MLLRYLDLADLNARLTFGIVTFDRRSVGSSSHFTTVIFLVGSGTLE
jgi:hypothetical protein